MVILVTGGTGSLGKVLIPKLLSEFDCRIRVLSRDEHKQTYLQEQWGHKVDFFIGDIRDRDRVVMAAKGCNLLLHLAAMKSVDKAEYNPNEAVSINILGTQNVVYAALQNKIPNNIMTSTDKAVEPLNIYGASKLTAEKLWIQSNCYSGQDNVHFSCVRYGNVLGSAGSVIEKWNKCILEKRVPMITNAEMTRYFILQRHAADFVIKAIKEMHGGEVFVPRMKSTTMIDLWNAFAKVKGLSGFMAQPQESGVRPGEKMHEMLISKHEVLYTTIVLNEYFIRWPNDGLFAFNKRGEKLSDYFKNGYDSQITERFTDIELQDMISEIA